MEMHYLNTLTIGKYINLNILTTDNVKKYNKYVTFY